jgi:hypothetical protein
MPPDEAVEGTLPELSLAKDEATEASLVKDPPGKSSLAHGMVVVIDAGASEGCSGVAPPEAPLSAPPAAQSPPAAAAAVDGPLDDFLKVIRLARELRTQQNYVGHYLFVLAAVKFGVRIRVWHGGERVDIVDKYAPGIREI